MIGIAMLQLFVIVLVWFVGGVDGGCCPGAKVYAPQLDAEYLTRRLVEEESGRQKNVTVAEGLLSKVAHLEEMVVEVLEKREAGLSAPQQRTVTQSSSCLDERVKLGAWEASSSTYWEVQGGFVEYEFTTAVVDFLKLSGDDYWEGSGGVVPAANRVLAMRISASADLFAHYWYTDDGASPTVICQEANTRLADLKSALANKSGYLALIVDATVKASWDAWLENSFPSVDSDCGSGCLVGVATSTGEFLSDVHTVLSRLDSDFLSCEVCVEEPAGVDDSLECCGESFVVAANYTPTHDVDFYGMYRRLGEVESECSAMREQFTAPISVVEGDYYWYRGATDEAFFTRFFYDFVKFSEYWNVDGQLSGFTKVLVMNVDYPPKFLASYTSKDPFLSVDVACQDTVVWTANLLVDALKDKSAHAVILTKPDLAAEWKFWAETEFAWLGAQHGCGTGCLLGTGVYEEGDLVGSAYKALSTIDGGEFAACKPCLYTAPSPTSKPTGSSSSTTTAGDAKGVSGMSLVVLLMILVHGVLVV